MGVGMWIDGSFHHSLSLSFALCLSRCVYFDMIFWAQPLHDTSCHAIYFACSLSFCTSLLSFTPPHSLLDFVPPHSCALCASHSASMCISTMTSFMQYAFQVQFNTSFNTTRANLYLQLRSKTVSIWA